MFDKELDRALWFILEADSENRQEIIEFLKGIPDILLYAIRGVLSTQNAISKDDREDDFFQGSVTAADGTIYSYAITYDYDEKTLEIRHDLAEPEDEDITQLNFSTELHLVDQELAFPTELDEEFYVGNFTKTCSINTTQVINSPEINKRFIPFLNVQDRKVSPGGYMEEQEFEYDLVNTATGYNIRRAKIRDYTVDIPIDISKQPEVITMNYIEQNFGEDVIAKKMTPPQE